MSFYQAAKLTACDCEATPFLDLGLADRRRREGMHMLCCGAALVAGHAPYCRKHLTAAYPPYDERRDPLRWRIGSVARVA